MQYQPLPAPIYRILLLIRLLTANRSLLLFNEVWPLKYFGPYTIEQFRAACMPLYSELQTKI